VCFDLCGHKHVASDGSTQTSTLNDRYARLLKNSYITQYSISVTLEVYKNGSILQTVQFITIMLHVNQAKQIRNIVSSLTFLLSEVYPGLRLLGILRWKQLDRAFSTHGRKEKCVQDFGGKSLEIIYHAISKRRAPIAQ
jgi:hypothetical protein